MAFMESHRSQVSAPPILSCPPSFVPEPWTSAKVPVPQRDESVEELTTFPAPQSQRLSYTHGTFALGNIRRTRLPAQGLISQSADASVLVITAAF
jgi:hypothetical protein